MLSIDELRVLPLDQLSGLSRDEKLVAWQQASQQLAPLIMRERALRLMVVAATFDDPSEGTHSVDIGSGYLCKVVVTMNYNIANTTEMKAAVIDACSPDQRDRLVKYKPELSVKEWKDGLTQEQRDKLAAHVTIKPGLPQLAILAPGEAGNKG